MRVLVLDGNENQAVAATRSLARAGHQVVVGAATSWSKAGWSRSASGSFRYPAPTDGSAAFVDRLVEVASEVPGTLIMPMTERTTLPISEYRERLAARGALLVLPDHATVLRAFDKHAMTTLARELGLTVPETRLLAAGDEIRRVREGLTFPLVLKPRSSERALPGGRIKATGAPVYASSDAELEDAIRALRTRCDEILVQEFIPGYGSGYFALTSRGRTIAEFAHRRLRDVRPTGSGSALRESAAPEPRARADAQALLDALHWHGVAMVEFRIRPDGVPVFIELNARFWNSLALAVYAGVDFPALLAQLAQGHEPAPLGAYPRGIRCRWMLGDVRNLLETWRGAPPGYPDPFPSRWLALARFLRPTKGTYHDNFQWRDPLPEIGDWLDFLFRRMPKRLGAA